MFSVMNSRLDNGLKIMLRRVENQRTVSCGIWVNQGVKDEDNNNNGISHLVEHLLFKINSKESNVTVSEKVSELRNIGARYNATTSKDCTFFYIDGLSRDLNMLLDALYHIVCNKSSVSNEVLENEKEIVIREAEGYLNSSRQIGEKVGQALWGDLSYGQIVIGKPNIIRSIDNKMIDDLISAKYVPENCVLVVVGGFEYDDVLKQINKIYSKWQDKLISFKDFIVDNNPGIMVEDRFGGDRSTLGIGFKTFPNNDSKSRYADILKDVLVRPGSALFENIREKRGLVYALNGFASSFSLAGNMGIAFSANNSDIKEIVEICMDEFRNIKKNGVDNNILQSIKKIRETELLYSIESTSNQLSYIGKNAIRGNLFILEDELREMQKINKEKMDEVVNDIFDNENMGIAVLGKVEVDKFINSIEI